MTSEARRQVLETCRRTSLLLDEIQPTLIPWAIEDGSIRRLFEAAVARLKASAQKFPREWIGMTAAQLQALGPMHYYRGFQSFDFN